MAQRYAYALLFRLTKSSTPVGLEVETLHGSVQAADAPEVSHFTSFSQLAKRFESMLSPPLRPKEHHL